MPTPHSNRRVAFTLIELLTVLAIIGVLLGILLPAVQQARETARRSECARKIHQIALALHSFESNFDSIPAVSTHQTQTNTPSEISWHVRILPYLDQQNLFDSYDASQGYASPSNASMSLNRIRPFLCGSSLEERTLDINMESIAGEPAYTTHYYGVMGPVGLSRETGNPYDLSWSSAGYGDVSAEGAFVFNPSQGQNAKNGRRLAEFQDGLSNTLMLGEISTRGNSAFRMWSRGARFGEWSAAGKSISTVIKSKHATRFNETSFGSNHPTGANFAMADGSVQHINRTIDIQLLQNLSTVAGREPESSVHNQ